ncbi:MAG: hypothetical protein ABJC89_00910 [Acidobacteriota bacterium]
MRTTRAILVLMGVYLVALAGLSLNRVMFQDAPIMLYAAFLIDQKHLVPYRDFFDSNMPGIYFVNILVGRLSGYTEIGVRLVDLLSLCALLGSTFLAMRRFGRQVAWCATISVGLLYLASGEWMSLQREYFGLLTTAAALAIVLTRGLAPWIKAAASGVLVGMAMTMKPQAVLVLPALFVFIWVEAGRHRPARPRGALAVATAAGLAVPLGLMLLYLWRNQALRPFADMVRHYWPLYNELSGSRPHYVLPAGSRLSYHLGHALMFGIHPGLPLLAAASVGFAVSWRGGAFSDQDRNIVRLLIGLIGGAWAAVAVAGKFWPYHWLPFNYFAILLASLALVEPRIATARRGATVAAMFLLLGIGLPWRVVPFWRPFDFPFARVQEISSYLEQHLAPGDTVAPLDWTEGAAHAMLIARAPLGMPFLYDFHFYHHVSSPYVRQLRQRLLDSFAASPPRFVIRVPRLAFAGPDTSMAFPELDRFLSARYEKAVDGQGYEIWQRRE